METLDKSKEVFKSVQDLVIQPEFNEGQKSFFDMYHTKFEDVDENKLEYTEINEIYLEIVDKLIEAKLKE